MELSAIIEGLITYAYLIIIITFHEFGHAWMAARCGDDTARSLGRVTLNPASHMDVIGTVILPLLMIFLSAAGSGIARFLIGWGKPVPVNIDNLRRPKGDDILVAMAGPMMNVLIAIVAMGVARLGQALGVDMLREIGQNLAFLSMFLCWFNLLPIPPLDGSHVMKHIVGMSRETYFNISRFGILIVIVAINIEPVRWFLVAATGSSVFLIGDLMGYTFLN